MFLLMSMTLLQLISLRALLSCTSHLLNVDLGVT